MNAERFRKELVSYCLVILGSLLFAVGDVMFVNPYHLAPGGVYGLANVFNALWGWKISLAGICMDIPLLIVGTIILGPRFGVKTVVSVILIPIFTFILENTWGYKPMIFESMDVAADSAALSFVDGTVKRYFSPDFFLNTVVSGIIYGVAIGVIFRAGATSGGSDIISMIAHKYTKISLGVLVLIVDSCISLATLFIPNSTIRLPIYSIVLIYIESKFIDLIVEGFTTYKTVFIVTDKINEVKDFIINDLERGGTCFSGVGLYRGQERKMIYVTLDRTGLIKLKGVIRSIDPNAFVNVIESSEIMGLGFKALPQEGE